MADNPQKPQEPARFGLLQVDDRVVTRLATEQAQRMEAAAADAATIKQRDAQYDANAAKHGGTVTRFATLGALSPAPAPTAASTGILGAGRAAINTPLNRAVSPKQEGSS